MDSRGCKWQAPLCVLCYFKGEKGDCGESSAVAKGTFSYICASCVSAGNPPFFHDGQLPA